jgi:hypothetical protein
MRDEIEEAVELIVTEVPGVSYVAVSRTFDAAGGRARDLGWNVNARVPRMGKRGQLLGRGSDEEVYGDGDTPVAAAEKAIQFFAWRREGKI